MKGARMVPQRTVLGLLGFSAFLLLSGLVGAESPLSPASSFPPFLWEIQVRGGASTTNNNNSTPSVSDTKNHGRDNSSFSGGTENSDCGTESSSIPSSSSSSSSSPSKSTSKSKSLTTSSSKKKNVSQKKPTKTQNNSKSSTTPTKANSKPKRATQTTQEADSLRRIKSEYKDAIDMGIAYDWVRETRILPKKKKKKKKLSQTDVLDIVDGESSASSSPSSPSSIIEEGQGGEESRLICLGPLATNLRHWHFSFRGCGIYEAGIYHGRIMLPKNYPLGPPRVQVWTPSGRFKPFTDICLSASAYHPESWSPRWTVLSLVQCLRLHMLTNPQEIGGINSSYDDTIEFAKKSLTWRVRWGSGKRMITVDHAKLLEQGLLTGGTTGENEKEQKEKQQPTIAEPISELSNISTEDVHNHTDANSNEVVQIEEAGENMACNDNLDDPNDSLSSKRSESLNTNIEKTNKETSSEMNMPSIMEPTVSITKTLQGNVAKKKKKKKKTKKHQASVNSNNTRIPAATKPKAISSKNGKEKATSLLQQQQQQQQMGSQTSIVLAIEKVFASPIRVAIFYFTMLLWLFWVTQ